MSFCERKQLECVQREKNSPLSLKEKRAESPKNVNNVFTLAKYLITCTKVRLLFFEKQSNWLSWWFQIKIKIVCWFCWLFYFSCELHWILYFWCFSFYSFFSHLLESPLLLFFWGSANYIVVLLCYHHNISKKRSIGAPVFCGLGSSL